MRTALTAALLSVLALAGCAAPTAQESAEIAAITARWGEAANAGDLEGIKALYTDDARIMPPNTAAGSGNAALEAAFGPVTKAGLKVELNTLRAMAAGDLGHEHGTYALTTAEGAPVDSGKYVLTLRRGEDGWRITGDIWNSDLPPPEPRRAIVTVDVEDRARFLSAWNDTPDRREQFASVGAPKVQLFGRQDDDRRFALLLEISDMERYLNWVGSAESEAAQKADAVRRGSVRLYRELE